MKLAYFVFPHLGGTYTVFTQLRRGLAPYDVDLRWLGLRHATDPVPGDAATFGTSVDVADFPDEGALVRRLVDIVVSEGFDGVVVNVLSDRIQTNLVRYLPDTILRFMLVHNITPGTYAAARAIAPHVHATICVCRRARDDLIERHGFPAARTHVIPNAVSLDDFPTADRAVTAHGEALRLLFLGRIEDASKGVLWLPEILARAPASVRLTIAGDGPDLSRLKAALPAAAPRVDMLGAVDFQAVPALLASHDVLLMPSRYEGLPMALVEAMAAGCVPVASSLRGVTDMVVDDGHDGLLFPVGDRKKAGELISALDGDRLHLRQMSVAARRKVARNFTLARMAMRYAEVLRKTAARPPPIAPALPIETWSLPQGLRPGLRTYLPGPVKNWLRLMRERL